MTALVSGATTVVASTTPHRTEACLAVSGVSCTMKPVRDGEEIDMPQMIVTDDYGDKLTVKTASELRTALVELTASTRAQLPTVYITVGADEMIVGVRPDRGILYWQSNSSDDAVATDGDNSEPVMYGANEILMPAGTELPLDMVLDAAQHFACTGRQPATVTWVKYRDCFRPPRAGRIAESRQTCTSADGELLRQINSIDDAAARTTTT